jgi:hypothetical protein
MEVLVTNGGPHPPDKWAALSASKISDLIQIDELSDSDAAVLARKAKPRFSVGVADALETSFYNVMADERAKVNSGAVSTRLDPFAVDSYLDASVTAVVNASAGTPFSDHFALSDVQSVVRNIIKQNFIEAANVQRSWAFDARGL